jgi:adenylate kinase
MLLLAPPGAGKGTQGGRLAAWAGLRHIAAGDLLRAEARAGTPRGRQIAACQARGDLVPDHRYDGEPSCQADNSKRRPGWQ